MDRQQALDLLANNHIFPGPYDFRLVVRGADSVAAMEKLRASLVAPDRVLSVSKKASRTGKYTSLRVSAYFHSPERVLNMYAVLQEMEEVLTSL